ncbi:MAG: thiamine phosphate synthase [Marinilabiliaceae bacterium]|nr:thiamine phosphate synthase [Marinilabiliaceae bacterium]
MLILITPPDFIEEEAKIVNRLFKVGVDRLHIRKPMADESDVAHYISQIDSVWYQQISIHYHYNMARHFHLGGVHFKSKDIGQEEKKNYYRYLISASCHTLEEVEACKMQCDYLFLSPIFDSISKQGYESRFTTENLTEASKNGIIDNKVIALGGINKQNAHLVQTIGFGGVAILGACWGCDTIEQMEQCIRELKKQKL